MPKFIATAWNVYNQRAVCIYEIEAAGIYEANDIAQADAARWNADETRPDMKVVSTSVERLELPEQIVFLQPRRITDQCA